MILYITYGNYPAGVYSSIVTDTILYLRSRFSLEVKLIAFVSLRGYFSTRKLIRKELPDALVIPAVPGWNRWKLNIPLLWLLIRQYRKTTMLALSPVAANLALAVKRKGKDRVVYYGEGATSAEWKEYNVMPDKDLQEEMIAWEKRAVLDADFRIAVSARMNDYWHSQFGYGSQQHTVIPCLVNFSHFKANVEKPVYPHGSAPEEKWIVFSGSGAPWHSFVLMNEYADRMMRGDALLKFMFLSNYPVNKLGVWRLFQDRIYANHLPPDKVPSFLAGADYGLLIREDSVTNRVAAPTKFAEYLYCGLKIIITNNIGDYPDFVRQHDCGYVLGDGEKLPERLPKPDKEEKLRMRALAEQYFTKDHFAEAYLRALKPEQNA